MSAYSKQMVESLRKEVLNILEGNPIEVASAAALTAFISMLSVMEKDQRRYVISVAIENMQEFERFCEEKQKEFWEEKQKEIVH